MENIQNINPDNIINALLSKGLVLVKKEDLQEILSTINASNMVDNRRKYISHKEVISMFGVTDYWLKKQREAFNTKLVCISGDHSNTAWKYQIESVHNELERLSI